MHCQHCGIPRRLSERRCRRCGHPLPQSQAWSTGPATPCQPVFPANLPAALFDCDGQRLPGNVLPLTPLVTDSAVRPWPAKPRPDDPEQRWQELQQASEVLADATQAVPAPAALAARPPASRAILATALLILALALPIANRWRHYQAGTGTGPEQPASDAAPTPALALALPPAAVAEPELAPATPPLAALPAPPVRNAETEAGTETEAETAATPVQSSPAVAQKAPRRGREAAPTPPPHKETSRPGRVVKPLPRERSKPVPAPLEKPARPPEAGSVLAQRPAPEPVRSARAAPPRNLPALCDGAQNFIRREVCKWQVCEGHWGQYGCPPPARNDLAFVNP